MKREEGLSIPLVLEGMGGRVGGCECESHFCLFYFGTFWKEYLLGLET